MKQVVARKLRILDFDIENRPLSYWVPDRPSAEITAIAACWVDDPKSMKCWLLGRDRPETMLEQFRELYDRADVVTGHYIRRHDLPIVQGAMLDYGLKPLGKKIAQDTKLDLVRLSDIPVSQENLLEMLEVRGSKYHMTQKMWREANRLTESGLALTERRVTSDVRHHIKMRMALLKRGLLNAPEEWGG